MWFLVLGIPSLVILGYLSYTFANGKVREELLDKLGVQRHRTSTASTPPRQLSAEEKQRLPDEKQPCQGTTDYKTAFPPSRRHVLEELLLLDKPHTQLRPPNYNKLLPDKETPDPKQHLQHVTATGFTLEEIQRLGDFPDYATLSGVPLPAAYLEFDVNTALPRPYRPFRWAYHQTMSLTKMEADWWLELHREYVDTIRAREQLFEKHGAMVLQTLPGSEIACKELMEMCVQFLCARYPQYFRVDTHRSVLWNGILHTQTNLKSTPPMEVLLHNIPEDFALMLRDPETGLYTLRAGMVMSSLGWTLGSKMGLPLAAIHSPVPDYELKMQFSMDRYFSKTPTEKPIQRGSWGLEIHKPLYMPPGDPHSKLRLAQNPSHTISDIHLRVDWQTLRRLPLSGAIVFNFKGIFTPVAEFADEPRVPSLVLKVLREGKKNLMEYKDTWHTEHVVIPYLEECEREQIRRGLMEGEWEVQTLEETPFFEGWEEKWHRGQGF